MSARDSKEREREIYNAGYAADDLLPAADTMLRVQRGSRTWREDRLRAIPTGSVVLDIGCGEGATSIELARLGFRVIGIDLSDTRVEIARERARREGLDVQFVQGDAERPDLPDESLDLVHCQSILHHLPDVPTALASYRRVLRPGGQLLVMEPGLLHPLAWIRRQFFPTAVHTPDEHPFVPRRLIAAIDAEFEEVETLLSSLTTLGVPVVEKVVGRRVAHGLLRMGEIADAALLRLPGMRELAWLISVHAVKRAAGPRA